MSATSQVWAGPTGVAIAAGWPSGSAPASGGASAAIRPTAVLTAIWLNQRDMTCMEA